MYETILVPLDGSPLAEVALPYAEEFADRLGAEITLLQVVSLSIHAYPAAEGVIEIPYADEEEKLLEARAKEYLERVGGRLKAKGVSVQPEVRVGLAADEITNYAARGDVGLVVMATHGRSGIGRWVLGSVAQKVVRATNRPLVLIRAAGPHPDVREKGIFTKILVPLDGSKESEAVIPYVEEVALKLKAEVTLLEVLKYGYQVTTVEGYIYIEHNEQQVQSDMLHAKGYLERVAAQLREKGVAVECEAKLGDAAEEIIQFADEIHADVVAMSTHGRSGVGRWVFGSVAEKILHEGNTPLLIVRSPGAKTR